MNDQKVYFRHIMLFAFKKGESAVYTAKDMLCLWSRYYKRKGMSTLVQEVHEGRGRKSSDINDSLSDLLSSDHFLSSREMAETLHASHTTILFHLRDLGKTLKYGRWLPHELSESNKLSRFTVASSLLSRNLIHPFLKRIVTSDEKWIQYDNSVSKRQ